MRPSQYHNVLASLAKETQLAHCFIVFQKEKWKRPQRHCCLLNHDTLFTPTRLNTLGCRKVYLERTSLNILQMSWLYKTVLIDCDWTGRRTVDQNVLVAVNFMALCLPVSEVTGGHWKGQSRWWGTVRTPLDEPWMDFNYRHYIILIERDSPLNFKRRGVQWSPMCVP